MIDVWGIGEKILFKMSTKKPVPPLSQFASIVVCRSLKRAVVNNFPFPLKFPPHFLQEEPITQDELESPACAHFQQVTTTVADRVASVLPKSLITDLAVEYLPKVHPTLEEALAVLSVLVKCGLKGVTFEKYQFYPHYFENDTDASMYPSLAAPVMFFGKSLTDPNVLGQLTRINLSRIDALSFPGHDEMMFSIATSAVNLKYLDLANRGLSVTDRTVRYFIPTIDEVTGGFQEKVPCPNLEYFSVYDCEVTAGVLVDLLLSHEKLAYLGFKRMGVVLKMLERKVERLPEVFGRWKTQLTHVAHVGTRRDVARMGPRHLLGVDASLVSTISKLCPKLVNIKVRVSDSTVPKLQPLMDRVKFLELCYSLASATNIGSNTLRVLSRHGAKLSSLAILCNRLKYSQLLAIGESCPNLSQLWLKLNLLVDDLEDPDGYVSPVEEDIEYDETEEEEEQMRPVLGQSFEERRIKPIEVQGIGHLSNLRIVHLQVGGHWAEETRVKRDVFAYLLKDKPLLDTCNLITTRDTQLMDDFVNEWVSSGWTPEIKTVNLSIPGWTQKPRVLPLTEAAVMHLSKLPKIKEIGNLMSWSLDQSWVLGFKKHMKNGNVDLTLVNR